MKLHFRQMIIVLICLTASIQAFEKQQDGVLFKIKKEAQTDPQLIKIQVYSDNIIRVIAAPEDSFSTRKSLMVVNPAQPVSKFTVTEDGDYVNIKTSGLTVLVNQKTGAVSFKDPGGKTLLKEKEQGGKIITAANVMGETTFHIQQIFDLPEEQAFYGLGAHQNDVWNYKGHDIDLWQYNIVDVIPFLVSSGSYGILWDNNSQTKLGDIRDYQSISALKLYGRDSSEGGLTAEYFKDTSFSSLSLSRPEPRIEHEFIDVNDPFPMGFVQNIPAVRWSGEIESVQPGIHKFRLYCCGYTKMWLDGKLVVDSWRQNWLPWTHIVNLNMEPGKKYSIRIEWIHTGGFIGLKYLTPENPENNKTLSLYSEVADQIDYYFIRGDNADQVISGYRQITGKASMLPKWAFGLWQSRERYRTQDEILSTVKEFRQRHIPFDNIVQDWFYWEEDKWGDHEFESSRYPNPGEMVKQLHNSLNAHLMISVWPKFYTNTKNYEELNKKGWLYKRNVEKAQRDWVGPGYVSTFYDPYSTGARKLYWDQINDKLFKFGIDGWWLDSTEPDIQSNLSRTETILRMGPTALGSASRYLNTFSLMNCKAVYEGQREASPEQRVFILTRSAFAGQQRYAATTWSGDIAARWYDLKAQVPAGLNFCISGIPYWTTDIGGFAVEQRYEHPSEADLEEWRELNTRWFQFGTFCPLLRVHGQYPYREMFNIAPEGHAAYQSMLAYDRLRYRLMPYIYSLAGMVTQNDYTIMRALVMDFSSDKNVLNIGDQFMFGPALLINPVSEYKARERKVYLPEGSGWYELRSGKFYKGGLTIQAQAPYSDIPVFVKEGAIIPAGPEIEYAEQSSTDPIRLFVYTGSDGAFNLYEDENNNYNYEQGKFSLIPLSYSEETQTLTIDKRKGNFEGMPSERTFEIVWIKKDKPSGMDFNSSPDKVITYNGSSITVKPD